MIDQALFDYFITRHLPRAEVLNRLPLSVSLDDFWPKLQQLRKSRSVPLPLTGLRGQPLWFVMTDSMMASGDRISSMARRDIDSIEPGEDIMTDGLIDEAFFTSFVEGAPISRLQSRYFLKSGADPASVGDLLAQNNLSAIRYAADHHYEPFSLNMLLAFARLLTSALETECEDFRASDQHCIPGRSGPCAEVPPAAEIPGMLEGLCAYLNAFEMHPLLKAAIAHACILLARPFDEGNERLARLLSYSILLRNGYSFFRQFALSGMMAQDGILYYKAMETIQDSRSEGDLTCFLEYYLGMLSRSVTGFDAYIAQKRRDEEKRKEAPNAADNPTAALAISESRQGAPRGDDSQPKQAKPAPNGAIEERDRMLKECRTPEGLVSLLIRQQSIALGVFDTKPYFENFGLTDKKVLVILQGLNTDASRHILEIYGCLHSNASRKYTCSELAEILKMKQGTLRRFCYMLVTLNLIRVTLENTRGNGHMILCFYAGEAMAA